MKPSSCASPSEAPRTSRLVEPVETRRAMPRAARQVSTSSTSAGSIRRVLTSLSTVLVLAATANAAKPTPAPATESVANAPLPGSVVNLEFTNGTSKASVVVDLASTDVHIEMRTRPKTDSSKESKPTAARSEAAPAEPKTLPGTAPAAATQAATDSVTRLVVAGIRRGQDLFLRGEHDRARQETEATLALRPTAEAHALAGSIRWVTGDRPGARLQWQEALRLDPAQPGVADMLARTEPGALATEPPKATAR